MRFFLPAVFRNSIGGIQLIFLDLLTLMLSFNTL